MKRIVVLQCLTRRQPVEESVVKFQSWQAGFEACRQSNTFNWDLGIGLVESRLFDSLLVWSPNLFSQAQPAFEQVRSTPLLGYVAICAQQKLPKYVFAVHVAGLE